MAIIMVNESFTVPNKECPDGPRDFLRIVEVDGKTAELRNVKGKPGEIEVTYVEPEGDSTRLDGTGPDGGGGDASRPGEPDG